MTTRLLDRTSTSPAAAPPPARIASTPDRGYDATASLTRLRDQMVATLGARRPTRWKEPPVFFFDRRRQAEFEAAQRTSAADPYADLAAAIAAELPDLFASVEVRRVARNRSAAFRGRDSRTTLPTRATSPSCWRSRTMRSSWCCTPSAAPVVAWSRAASRTWGNSTS